MKDSRQEELPGPFSDALPDWAHSRKGAVKPAHPEILRNRCGKTMKHTRLTHNRQSRTRSQDTITYPQTAQAFILGELFTTADPIPQISPSHKFPVICQVVPATETRNFFFIFFFPGVLLGGYLVGNSKQPFGQLKATAIQLYPSRQQPCADKQPRHKAVVSCRAVAHHFPSQTTAVE